MYEVLGKAFPLLQIISYILRQTGAAQYPLKSDSLHLNNSINL